ncbi:MAG: hypothetical protein COB04_17825 [Gammaproteobacteria bacterium]|nr:MAG: hypothetical protein COB04_17825 [Gammaproteobacteria bacterium]
MSVKKIKVGDTSMWVEIDDTLCPESNSREVSYDGTEEVSALSDKMDEVFEVLTSTIQNVAKEIETALQENKPDEFEIELNFGFGGKAGIPCLVSSKANAAIKFKAKWKK